MMALRHNILYPVVRYRQHGQNLALTSAAETVTGFDEALRDLVADLFASMYAADGVGLAAPQVGIGQRIAVIDISFGKDTTGQSRMVLVNPEIVAATGKATELEGCLSIPGLREKVTRAAQVTVRAQNPNGEWYAHTAGGLMARAIQHETDHLDGKLFVHRLSRLKRGLIEHKLDKLVKVGKW